MLKTRNNIILIGLIVFFFILGYEVFLYGLRNGQEIAPNLTKPAGASVWSTSQEQINLTMYGICALGGLWIIISHVLLILFIAGNFICFSQSNQQ